MARLADLVLDATHPASLARFWAAAIDGAAIAPYDDAELERLAEAGITDVEDDPTVLVLLPGGLRFWLRLAEGPITGHLHLDLKAPDVDAEADRLATLGASLTRRYDSHVVMADPEGHPFCVFPE